MANTLMDNRMIDKVPLILDKLGKNITFQQDRTIYNHLTGKKVVKNLLSADNSFMKDTKGTWNGGGINEQDRVLLTDEGISNSGLPFKMATALKVTWKNNPRFANLPNLALTAAKHYCSIYLYFPTGYTGSGHWFGSGDFSSATGTQIAYVNHSLLGQWQRLSFDITPNAIDLNGTIEVNVGSVNPSYNAVFYLTCVQVEQSDGLSDFNHNSVDITIKCSPPLRVQQNMINGDSIKKSDIQIIVPAKDLALTLEIGLRVNIDSENYKITNIKKHYSGNIVSAYTLTLRK